MSKRRLDRWLLLIVLLAFALRLIATVHLGKLPLYRTPQLDSNEYLTWARRIAAGDFRMPSPPPHGPGYPLFLAAVLALSGGSLAAVGAVQAAVGAWTCWFTGSAARAWFGEHAGIASAAILSVYAPLIWIDASLLAEGLLMCLVAAFLWTLATHRSAIAPAAILAVAILVRPTAVVLLPLLLAFGAKTWRSRIMAGVFIVVLAYAIPMQAYGGLNFYLGNSPFRDGFASARLGGDWDRLEPDAARHGLLTPHREDRYFIRKTFDEIRQRPIAYATLLLGKSVWTFQNDEVRDTFSFYFFRQFSPLLWLTPFAVLFALAAAGAFAADWHSEGVRASAVYIVLTAGTSIALVVGARYRLPIAIGLALFAGNAIAIRPLQTRMLIIALIAGATSLLWRHMPTHNFAEEWAWTARSLQREGSYIAAEQAARNAIKADPRNALAHEVLGTTLLAEGRIPDGRAALQRAVTLNADFFDARLDLGRASAATNDLADAERQFAAAMQIDPRDARPVKEAAEVAMRQHDLRRAIALDSRAASLDPHDARVRWTLARLFGAAGDPNDGVVAAQHAALIEPPTAEQWLLLATLATHARRFDVAQNALQQAQAAGADPISVTFSRALLAYQSGDLARADSLVGAVLERLPKSPEALMLKTAIAHRRGGQ